MDKAQNCDSVNEAYILRFNEKLIASVSFASMRSSVLLFLLLQSCNAMIGVVKATLNARSTVEFAV